MSSSPVMSAIVIAQNNEATISKTLSSILKQDCSAHIQVILVDSGSDRTVKIVRKKFPRVEIVDLDRPVLPGGARNEGLRIAKGDFVSFPGSHVVLAPGSLSGRIRAHQDGYDMVTGVFLNGTETPAGWASYFMDHAASLPGRPSGLLGRPPSSCSYKRELLLAHGPFPDDRRAGEDTVVNQRLWDAGFRAYRDQNVRLTHVTRCTTPEKLAQHHLRRGRAYGRILSESARPISDLRGYRKRRLDFIDRCTNQWGEDLLEKYLSVKSLIVRGVTAAWLGANFQLNERVGSSRRPVD